MSDTYTPLQQSFIDAGYKKYVSESNKLFKSTDTLFQKCIRDEKGKKYFIDAWYYPEFIVQNEVVLPESFQAEVQFTLQDGERLGVMSFYKDIAKVEMQMEELWVNMQFGYNELNEEY